MYRTCTPSRRRTLLMLLSLIVSTASQHGEASRLAARFVSLDQITRSVLVWLLSIASIRIRLTIFRASTNCSAVPAPVVTLATLLRRFRERTIVQACEPVSQRGIDS